MFKRVLLLSSLLISTNLLAKDDELLELVSDYQNAKYEYGEFHPKSLEKQRKVQIYAQSKWIVFSTKEYCLEDIEKHCANFKSERDIVTCLDADRDALTESCDMRLSSFLGGKYLENDVVHKGIKISKGSYFFYNPTSVFNPDTKIDAAVLTEGFNYKGVDYKNGRIDFNASGLSSGRLAYDQVVQGVRYSAGVLGVFFHANGQVKSGVLAETTKLDGYEFKALKQVSFDESGKVTSGTIAQDYVIAGENYHAGDFVSLR